MEPEQPATPESTFTRRLELGEAMEPRSSIDLLPEMMGYVETRELSELRNSIVEALRRGEEARDLQTHYHMLAEAVVDELPGLARAGAQIGLIVQMGIMRRDGGSGRSSAKSSKMPLRMLPALELRLQRRFSEKL